MEAALGKAHAALDAGDEKQALKELERVRQLALKQKDVATLRAVLELAATSPGERAKDWRNLEYATTQNVAFLERVTDVAVVSASSGIDDRVRWTRDDSTVHEPSFTAVGRNGQLTVTPTKIVISRKGAIGFVTQGHKGVKEIDLVQISAVQFKKPGPLTVGYIQFSFLGGGETKRGMRDAVNDENSILFAAHALPQFEEAKQLLDEYRARLRGPATPHTPAPRNELDDLERLASLRERGILTEEEFQAKKRQLLGID